jgi:hypothetical protein
MGVYRWDNVWVSGDYGVTWTQAITMKTWEIAISGNGLFGVTGYLEGPNKLLVSKVCTGSDCPSDLTTMPKSSLQNLILLC